MCLSFNHFPFTLSSSRMGDELGERANFPWESNQWAFSNSENSGGSDDTKGKRPPVSGSNTPTPRTTPALTPIPTPTATPSTPVGPKRNRNGASKKGKGGGGLGGGESDHEIHIWTERERRKKMRNMFANLHALLPQLPPKVKTFFLMYEFVNLDSSSLCFQCKKRKKGTVSIIFSV